MPRYALAGPILVLALALPCPAAEPPPADDARAAKLAAEAEAALNAWKYERAQERLDQLAKAAPDHGRLAPLRLRLLVRVGNFGAAARIALKLSPEAAAKLPIDETLKTGRALLAAGKRAQGRRWILAAARRAGPASPERYADSLAALLGPGGGQGLVSHKFAAEMASPVGERLEHAKAYAVVAGTLAKRKPAGKTAAYLELACFAAQRRLAELSDVNPPGLSRKLAAARALAWQAPVGVAESPEHCALAGELLLVASQPAGRALPRKPLPARLRAFEIAGGRQLWSLELPPMNEPGTLGAEAAGKVAYSSRIDGLVAGAGRAYLLVKTSRAQRVGASRRLSEIGAQLVAVDLKLGRRLWTARAARGSSRLYLAGRQLVAAGFRSLAGYSTASGKPAWPSREFARSFSGAAVVAGGGLVLPGWKETACVDPATGKVKWRVPRPAGSGFARTCLTAGRLVVIGEKGAGVHGLLCLDAAAGKKLWTRTFRASRGGSEELALALASGTLVAGRGAALRAIDARSGRNSWRAALPLPAGAAGVGMLGAGPHVLWSAGGELVLMDARNGRPLWWTPGSSSGLEILGMSAAAKSRLAFTLEGSSPRLVTAWRVRPPKGTAPDERAGGGRELAAIARQLAGAGEPAAAERLLDIARSYAAPGVLGVEWAVFRRELAAGGKSPSLARCGLLRAALAKAAPPGEKTAALNFFRTALGDAKTDPAARSLAAAALLLFGDTGGARHLAAHPGNWTGRKARLEAVLAACRLAGPGSAPVLLAGLTTAQGGVRVTLVERLAAYKGKEVQEALEKVLFADPSRDVRIAAAGSLVSVIGGNAAVPYLKKAYKKEEDFLAKNRLRALLVGLGQRPDPVVRPVPVPVPTPTPRPVLNRERALARAKAMGKLLWTRDDPGDKLLLWIALEKKFLVLFNAADGSLAEYKDFLKMVGRKEVTVTGMAYGTDSVWAGTDKGAFVFDRRTRAWSQLVINLDFDLLEARVEKVTLAKNAVTFIVKGKGTFEFNIRTKKWRKV